MRWTPLLQDVRVDALAADDRSGFFVDHDNATVGRFDASGRAVISDAGWGCPDRDRDPAGAGCVYQ